MLIVLNIVGVKLFGKSSICWGGVHTERKVVAVGDRVEHSQKRNRHRRTNQRVKIEKERKKVQKGPYLFATHGEKKISIIKRGRTRLSTYKKGKEGC